MRAVFPIKAPKKPEGPCTSILLAAESDKFHSVSVVAVPPRRRDFWRVLLGRYEPKVIRRRTHTLAAVDRALKEIYSPAALDQLNKSPLLDYLEER